MTDTPAETNRARVVDFWRALYDRDWERIATFFTEDSEYTDVASPADDVAHGPEQIVARLRLGLERLSGYEHGLRLMVADADTVVTEHTETWHWHTGEEVTLPFVSVQELRDGSILRWWDYWDLQTLLNAAPVWWIEHIAQGYS
ncbi:MAG: nuclear transport factor 2 family protein [Acidimicrobiales bacterium]